MPVISVVMGVYNGRIYVKEALDTILSQTFADFEFIIINDGSTDETAAIIQEYNDSRIRLFSQNRQGLTKSLNRGIKIAAGKYIARMDADDLAQSSRFQKQLDFLETNPDIVVLGTSYQQINQFTSQKYTISPPESDKQIRKELLKGNPICHPSVMMRKDALEKAGFYNESFVYVQDYELWSRMAQTGELANLPDPLLSRRYHAASTSNDWRTEFYRWRLFIKANHLAIERLNGSPFLKLLTFKTLALFAFGSIKNSWQYKTNKS